MAEGSPERSTASRSVTASAVSWVNGFSQKHAVSAAKTLRTAPACKAGGDAM